MVMPLWDDNSDRRLFPFVNIAFIVLNIVVFVLFQGMGTNEKFTYAFSVVPEEIITGQDIDREVQIVDPLRNREVASIQLEHTPYSVYLTLLVSMFMHGGWLHLAGNMLFLWIFGDNLEDVLGHVRYAVFYLLCGVLASLTHVAVTIVFKGNPFIPSLGASGAISGVMGGYVLLFPFRKVTVLLLRILTVVPAWMALGLWFVFQIVSSLVALSRENEGGGVAYGAHIGGFLAGVVLVKVFALGVETDRHEWPGTSNRWTRTAARPGRFRR